VEFVFAYGSLSAGTGSPPGAEPAVVTLMGASRVWDVAMDNRQTIAGYKYYVAAADGARPAVHVVFLDLADAPGVACPGLLLPVSEAELAALDRRERNYDRHEVSDRIRPDPGVALAEGRRIWAYRGSTAARERYRAALAAGSAVVERSYRTAVEAEFARRGLRERYDASTREPECPVIELTRVDVPA
jgi:hypothetical protein